jgi:DNA polymerase IV
VLLLFKSILFIDPPSFCTTVEGLVAPALRSRPIVIAPPGADRATVLALSDEARLAGITRGMLLPRARKLCRDLVILPPNPRLYARASRALHEVLRRYAPIIEPRGYGHAFLDVSGTRGLFGPAVDLAERIQRETREQVRLPLSVGVATNKLISETAVKAERLGGSATALESLLEVLAGNEASFLAPLSVEILPDVPDSMRERLDEYQLELIGEIAALREQQACAVFGPPGRQLVARARGIDPRPVLPPALKAEFTVAHTLSSDSNDLGLLHTLLRRMSEILGRRLRTRHLVSRRLVLELHYTDYQLGRRSLPLRPALLDIELWDAARRAFTLANSRPVAVRAVTMTVDRLLEAELQLELFDVMSRPTKREPEKAQSLQKAIDTITTRWGKRGVLRGGRGERREPQQLLAVQPGL